jgi:hypothetical protein
VNGEVETRMSDELVRFGVAMEKGLLEQSTSS